MAVATKPLSNPKREWRSPGEKNAEKAKKEERRRSLPISEAPASLRLPRGFYPVGKERELLSLQSINEGQALLLKEEGVFRLPLFSPSCALRTISQRAVTTPRTGNAPRREKETEALLHAVKNKSREKRKKVPLDPPQFPSSTAITQKMRGNTRGKKWFLMDAPLALHRSHCL